MTVGTVHLAVVTVKYERALRDVTAVKAMTEVADSSKLSWVVIDNSPQEDPEAAVVSQQLGLKYTWLGGNKGISKAFNHAITTLDPKVTHVALFDQDTSGIAQYLNMVEIEAEAKMTILMPLVFAGEKVISPCRRIGTWYRPLRRLGKLPTRFSGISSGLIVSRDVFAKVHFDEGLFVDYVDHRFLEQAQATGVTFRALWGQRLKQDFSRDSDTISQALRRYSIFRRDAQAFHSSSLTRTIQGKLLVLARALRATAQYRTLDFLLSKGERHG